jgi:hypothetical protein
MLLPDGCRPAEPAKTTVHPASADWRHLRRGAATATRQGVVPWPSFGYRLTQPRRRLSLGACEDCEPHVPLPRRAGRHGFGSRPGLTPRFCPAGRSWRRCRRWLPRWLRRPAWRCLCWPAWRSRLCAAGFQSRLCRATWWRLLSAGLRLGRPWLPGWCLRRPWLRRRPVALVVGWLGTAAATAALVGVGTAAAAMGLGTAPLVRLPELPAATSDASRAYAFAARIFSVTHRSRRGSRLDQRQTSPTQRTTLSARARGALIQPANRVSVDSHRGRLTQQERTP